MANIFDSTTSPYLALWFLFLAFVSIVLVFQVFCLALRAFYAWRIRTVIKKHSGKPVA